MQITGFCDARIFIDQLRAMPKAIRKEVRRGVRAAAELSAEAARAFAPYRTGDLRESIIVRSSPYTRGRVTNDLMCEVHVGAFYSGFVDAGVAGRGRQPDYNVAWFRKAIKSVRSEANEIVKDAIRKGLQSTVNSSGLTINGKNLGFLDAVELG